MAEFKEFFDRMQEIEESRQKVYREMSLRLDSDTYSDLTKKMGDSYFLKTVLVDSKFVENTVLNGISFKVYENGGYLIFIADDRYVAARIEYKNCGNSKIKMTSIEKARPFKDLMYFIFRDYLLKRFNEIESDATQTVEAFKFYKGLAAKQATDGGFEMFIRGKEGDKLINNPSDMDSTYGYNDEHVGYTYVIKKK
jgi:hypothetical protein